MSRGTVAAAYDQLVAEGYLLTRQRAGTQVADLGPVGAPAEHGRTAKPTRLDLRPGTPDVTSFPVADWLRCTRRALTDAPASAFGYGDVRGRIRAAKRPRRLPRPYPRSPRPARAGRDHLRRHPVAVASVHSSRAGARHRDRDGEPGIRLPPRRRPAGRAAHRRGGRWTSSAPGRPTSSATSTAAVSSRRPTSTRPASRCIRRAATRSRPGRARAAGSSSRTTTTASFGTTANRSARCRGRRRITSSTSGTASKTPGAWAAAGLDGAARPPGRARSCSEAVHRSEHRPITQLTLRRADHQPWLRPPHPHGAAALSPPSRPAR